MPTPISGISANKEMFENQTALQARDNMRFIADSVAPIANAIAMGKSSVNLLTYRYCNLMNLQNYYQGLGYQIDFPNVLYGLHQYESVPMLQAPNQPYMQPRMIISWSLPYNSPPTATVSTQMSNYTISTNNETVFVDSTLAAIVIYLPTSPLDGWVETINWSAGANTVIINGNGNTINGSSNPLALPIVNSSATLIYMQGYGWAIFS